jgi:hypothetical protein
MTNPEAFDQTKFKKKCYPANPFSSGVLVEASQVPIEVFANCVYTDLALERANCPERVIHPGPTIFVRLDAEWVKAFQQRKRIIQTYIVAALRDRPEVRQKHKEQIQALGVKDFRLQDDLVEVDKTLATMFSSTPIVFDD